MNFINLFAASEKEEIHPAMEVAVKSPSDKNIGIPQCDFFAECSFSAKCCGCGDTYTGAHSCKECYKPCHITCGWAPAEEDEGYSGSPTCYRCKPIGNKIFSKTWL